MCFNYALNTSVKSMEERFNATFIRNEYTPAYHVNAFTFPDMPVIANDVPEQIQFFKWGLIPHWVKNDKKAEDIKKFTLNARAETIFDKPSFKSSIRSRRCIIPATGFFEWKHINKEKIPYFISVNGRELISFAGIWSSYSNDFGQNIQSFSIITSDANAFMEVIHNTKKRMPVILNEDEEKKWLKDSLTETDINQMIAKREHDFQAYTVSKSLGNAKINTNVKEILNEINYGTLNF